MDGISPELLAILVCPETHQPLTLAPPEMVARLADLQARDQLKNRAGDAVSEPVQAALVRQDRKIAYLVSAGIPIMLIDEGVPLDQI